MSSFVDTLEWIAKTLHIGLVCAWLVGLVLLQAVLAVDARAPDLRAGARRHLLAGNLYLRVASPAAIVAVALGAVLIGLGFEGDWLPAKLALVTVLVAFHLFTGRQLLRSAKGRNDHGPWFFVALAPVPVLLFSGIALLAAIKPQALALPLIDRPLAASDGEAARQLRRLLPAPPAAAAAVPAGSTALRPSPSAVSPAASTGRPSAESSSGSSSRTGSP